MALPAFYHLRVHSVGLLHIGGYQGEQLPFLLCTTGLQQADCMHVEAARVSFTAALAFAASTATVCIRRL
jgi:hypothetical protein